MSNSTTGLQAYLFEAILSRFSKKSLAIIQLSDLLQISQDSVYRRIRCEKDIDITELEFLAKHFNISLDAYIYTQTNGVNFSFNVFSEKIERIEDYLDKVVESTTLMSRVPNSHTYYAANEIPIFYYCFFPEIIYFKLIVWGNNIWELPYLHNKPIDFELINERILKQSKQLIDLYRNMNSTELWSINLFDNTINQIEYYVQAGMFADTNDALMLCEKLQELLNQMEQMCKAGRKFHLKNDTGLGGSFQLYHNEMIYNNNTIMLDSPGFKSVYATFTNPNYIGSQDTKICNFTKNWFNKAIKKSKYLSGDDERSRNAYFQGISKKINTLRKKIELVLEEV